MDVVEMEIGIYCIADKGDVHCAVVRMLPC